MELNYYQILQVDPAAEPEVIAGAYRRLVAKYHPDVAPGAEAETRIRQITAAYAVLADPVQRAAYDARRIPTPRNAGGASPPPATTPLALPPPPGTVWRYTPVRQQAVWNATYALCSGATAGLSCLAPILVDAVIGGLTTQRTVGLALGTYVALSVLTYILGRCWLRGQIRIAILRGYLLLLWTPVLVVTTISTVQYGWESALIAGVVLLVGVYVGGMLAHRVRPPEVRGAP